MKKLSVLLVGLVFLLAACGPKSLSVLEVNNPQKTTPISSTTSQADGKLTQTAPTRLQSDSDLDGIADAMDECENTLTNVAVDSLGCPIPLYMKVNIGFASSQAEFDPLNIYKVERLAVLLRANPQSKVTIEGHTDNVGDESQNQHLSLKRARSIKASLINFYDIAPDRITAVGYGETKPLVPNKTEEGRERNRRVEVVVSGFYQANTSYVALKKQHNQQLTPSTAHVPQNSAAQRSAKNASLHTNNNALVTSKALATPSRITLHRPYNFQFSPSRIQLSSSNEAPLLNSIGAFLKRTRGTVAVLDGYTDNSGDTAQNNALSLQRATAVKNYIVTTYGISPARLKAFGHGEQSPIASNETAAGRNKNRRVTITVNRRSAAPVEKTRFQAKLRYPLHKINTSMKALGNRYELQFGVSKTELNPESRTKIDEVGQLLRNRSEMRIIIEGHAQSSASKQESLEISKARALKVKKYLIETYNISEERLRVIGYGDDLPIADNTTQAGKSRNNRVSIKLDRF